MWPLTFSTWILVTPSIEYAFSKISSGAADSGAAAATIETARKALRSFIRRLTTETGTKGSRCGTASTRARADLSLGAQDTRTGPPVATAGCLRVRQQGPGVEDVPDGDDRGNISADRAPDSGRTAVRKAGFQGEPAARPPAARVAEEKCGDGGRRKNAPDPRNRGAKRGQVAPDDGGRGEAD